MSTLKEGAGLSKPIVGQQQQRLYYMDNLRAWAMLVGIVFHVALAYSPYMHNIWFVK